MPYFVVKSVNCPFVLHLRKLDVRGPKCGDLVLDEEKGEDCQLWKFDGDLDSSTRIINKEGDALDVENWHTGGRNLIARAPVNALNQKFKFEDGFLVHIMTKKVVDVEGDRVCGAQLVLNERGCGDCQEWELIDQCPV
jgi:hypothetical protein